MRLATPVRAAVLGAALVVVSLVAAPARAAGGGLDDDKEARRLFERAELSFNVGKFGEALADYQSAYEAKPLPGFLFNIAQCYRNMGNFERARFFFRRYLALDPRAPNRHRVDELIAEMTKQLEAKQAETAPAAALTPPPVAAPSLAAVEPGPADTSASVLPPSSLGMSEPLVTAKATAPAPARRPLWRRWWFWTGVAAVVAGGAVAAFLLTRPETRTPGSLQPIDGR
jgi:tetratricopeptide (TPR) repeat protein